MFKQLSHDEADEASHKQQNYQETVEVKDLQEQVDAADEAGLSEGADDALDFAREELASQKKELARFWEHFFSLEMMYTKK